MRSRPSRHDHAARVAHRPSITLSVTRPPWKHVNCSRTYITQSRNRSQFNYFPSLGSTRFVISHRAVTYLQNTLLYFNTNDIFVKETQTRLSPQIFVDAPGFEPVPRRANCSACGDVHVYTIYTWYNYRKINIIPILPRSTKRQQTI